MNVEKDLIERCIKGELEAQKEIYDLFASTMYALCIRYLNEKETAKDILQEGFIKVYQNIHQYNGKGSFEGWIRAIFVNESLKHLSKNQIKTIKLEEIEHLIEDVNATEIEKLSTDDLLNCITKLPERSRIIFNLYAIEGFSNDEIAKKMKMSENSVRAIFSRARRQVQENVLKKLKK